jgi:predicted AAA+ superfamily ATPase
VLEVAALSNGQLINYAALASDAQVARSTVQQYFQILKDTLIATELPAWTKTVKRKAIGKSKLYFFDVGVVRHLQHRRGLRRRAPEFGEAFETYIHHELRSYIDYAHPGGELCYWRSRSGFEVDFILDNSTAIEVKAKTNVGQRDLRGLLALAEERLTKNLLLVSLEGRPRRIDDIQILPWDDFLDGLWEGRFT